MSRRPVEIDLDAPRLALVAAGLALLFLAGFWIGRATAPRDAAVPAPAAAPAVPGAAGAEEDIAAARNIFDETGAGAAVRDPRLQATEEPSLRGSFELDLGSWKSRGDAEAVVRRARGAGVPALVAGAPGGGYRVVGGPFADRAGAEAAARKLSRLLGRPVRVRGRGR